MNRSNPRAPVPALLRTDRTLLRRWTPGDREPFAVRLPLPERFAVHELVDS
jgi:hypothetical protein